MPQTQQTKKIPLGAGVSRSKSDVMHRFHLVLENDRMGDGGSDWWPSDEFYETLREMVAVWEAGQLVGGNPVIFCGPRGTSVTVTKETWFEGESLTPGNESVTINLSSIE